MVSLRAGHLNGSSRRKTKTMCSYLDGKSLRVLELTIDLYEAVNREARRIGPKVDNSEIGRLIDEAKSLVISPIHPTTVNSPTHLSTSYQNPPFGLTGGGRLSFCICSNSGSI